MLLRAGGAEVDATSRHAPIERLRSASMYARFNPVTVSATLVGAGAALLGARAAGGAGRAGGPLRRTRRAGRTAAAVAAAGLAGGLAGRLTQRWTWSDERIRDEFLDAEYALWE
jgi:hypothetical protein